MSVVHYDPMMGPVGSRYDANAMRRQQEMSIAASRNGQVHQHRDEVKRRADFIQQARCQAAVAQLDHEEHMSHIALQQREAMRREKIRRNDEREHVRKSGVARSRAQRAEFERQTEEVLEQRLQRAEELRNQALEQRSFTACHGDVQRAADAARRRRSSIAAEEAQYAAQVADGSLGRRSSYGPEALSAERRREKAYQRNQVMDTNRRALLQLKMEEQEQRSQAAKRARAEAIRQRQREKDARREEALRRVRMADEMFKMRQRQWEDHFEESVAIGRETAAHNSHFAKMTHLQAYSPAASRTASAVLRV